MKKVFLVLTATLLMFAAKSQTITAAEFFVDNDPGPGNGTTASLTAGSDVSFNVSVPTNTLSNGFHFVCIRTKDNSGKWGLFEIRGFYVSATAVAAPNITGAEFFIDNDPGAGNGTPVGISTGTDVTFTANISAALLSNGFHFACIRVKNSDNTWSLFEIRGFYVSNAAVNPGNIIAAEFFVDTDPGSGNGTPVTITPGNNVTFLATLPTSALSNGFHTAAIRVKNADNTWSLFETRAFYVSSTAVNPGNISAAEFFVDTDPGRGNGTPVTITPGNNVSFVANIPVSALSKGFHLAAIRVKNTDGTWSLFEHRGFYISTAFSNIANLTSAEYFIDADPGVGNGSPISIPNTATINQSLLLNVPGGTADGDHLLAIRVKDSDGKWGLFETATITVSGQLPLTFLNFEGEKKDGGVLLHWQTTSEINTDHFDVERSVNGVDFLKIGQVKSKDVSGVNDYSFMDNAPKTGVNLYRLKQVDIDGKFNYSTVVKILFDQDINMVVYPNPASDKVQIRVNTATNKWIASIYDAQGRLVKQQIVNLQNGLVTLDISSFAKGVYSIILNSGIEILQCKCVKQ